MLLFFRYGLPALLALAGVVVLFVADGGTRLDGFAMCLGAALSVLLMNVLFRAGATGDLERDEEAAARDYLTEHGHWPDEEPAAETSVPAAGASTPAAGGRTGAPPAPQRGGPSTERG